MTAGGGPVDRLARTPNEAVALVEVASIARGYVTLDQLAKRAEVTVHEARPVTPGKFIILFAGDVAPVQESLEAAREQAQSLLLDELLLPYAHVDLMAALRGKAQPAPGEAIGIVEMSTVASTVHMADVALKATEVSVLKMHLAIGIGGKGYFNLAGELADVEAALDAVRAAARSEQVIGIELIPRPHPEVRGFMG